MEIEHGSYCWLGRDVVEVLELRDRGYALVKGAHFSGLTPLAHLVPLSDEELAELEAPDDADSLHEAALELAGRVAAVRAQHGRDYVAAIPVVGALLDELDALASGQGDDDGHDDLAELDLPPPGPGVAARALADRPSPWPPGALERQTARHLEPVATPPQQASTGRTGVATATPVSRSTTATAGPPVQREEARAPIVNGAPPSARKEPPRVTVTPAVPRPGDGELAIASASPPARRDEDGGAA